MVGLRASLARLIAALLLVVPLVAAAQAYPNRPVRVIVTFNADAIAIIGTPEFQERLARDAIDPVATSPEAFAAQIRADLERWAKIVKAAGIQPQ